MKSRYFGRTNFYMLNFRWFLFRDSSNILLDRSCACDFFLSFLFSWTHMLLGIILHLKYNEICWIMRVKCMGLFTLSFAVAHISKPLPLHRMAIVALSILRSYTFTIRVSRNHHFQGKDSRLEEWYLVILLKMISKWHHVNTLASTSMYRITTRFNEEDEIAKLTLFYECINFWIFSYLVTYSFIYTKTETESRLMIYGTEVIIVSNDC